MMCALPAASWSFCCTGCLLLAGKYNTIINNPPLAFRFVFLEQEWPSWKKKNLKIEIDVDMWIHSARTYLVRVWCATDESYDRFYSSIAAVVVVIVLSLYNSVSDCVPLPSTHARAGTHRQLGEL